jgi:protease I
MAVVAIVVDEMFEEQELAVPRDRLREAGHEVILVGVTAGKQLQGVHRKARAVTERGIEDARPNDFDALVIPGGYSPDHLRTDARMVSFTHDMFHAGKPVAAVCHAGSLLVEADLCQGRTLTSWRSIKTDLENAGAQWIDRGVVEDGNLITARSPKDLRAFVDAILDQLEHGVADRFPEAARREEGADPESAPTH